MSDRPVLKQRPHDFLVREAMVVEHTGSAGAQWRYLLLRKSGYTTMEAIRLVAAELALPTADVTYGGLKDEDGITEQLIAVPAGVPLPGLGPEGWRVADRADDWLDLHHHGYGAEPLAIGRLEGNGFRITVRNLDPGRAERLAGLRKHTMFFLNYYDTQRFGVPGGPKRTHLVGRAMLAGDWDTALRELAGLRAPESPQAAQWQGPAEEFFRTLDPRTASFYLAAQASADWNAALRRAVDDSCGPHTSTVELDGLEYRYADKPLAVLATAAELPYAKYTFTDGTATARTSARPTVVQTTVSLSAAAPDELNPGRSRIGLGFFLPSGSYATAAVRQLLAHGASSTTTASTTTASVESKAGEVS
ncbi:tRNA pseudouridine(13) synthase TruD [Streptomyces sp. SP17BM10]|uniref:tRNA pseudouridine(13) synthase TruD n=1 Tax=Streptomyces sp. SP17BM10 TaxID=3002530 RepID=UPI002E790D7E|nr:tRNA pseudouridine(13) synthase TruD [Streptomyces sp. SP17BM10]MEE1782946.1 tRNA pseudouridine(13) synthase TruD [Streptomyces sp. SP17BM10]